MKPTSPNRSAVRSSTSRVHTGRFLAKVWAWITDPSACHAAGPILRSWFGKGTGDDPWTHVKSQAQYRELYERYPSRFPKYHDAGITLGILKSGTDHTHQHERYMRACDELAVPYVVMDRLSPDWIDQVRRSRCDGVIVHPTANDRMSKNLADEQMWTLTTDLCLPTRPLFHEMWFYESKRRMANWLKAHDLPHPATQIFHDPGDAHTYLEHASFPLLCKTDLGSAASGVFLLDGRSMAGRFIAKAFAGGIRRRAADWRDPEWGSILFQEFIPDAREFRLIQIGKSWFGHEKGRANVGAFHSGSGKVEWSVPPREVFDLCHRASLIGGFHGMNYDVLVSRDGKPMINELQALFASYNPSQMYLDGKPGRFLRDGGEWRFEEGLFCHNGCANLRVEEFVEDLLSARRREGKTNDHRDSK